MKGIKLTAICTILILACMCIGEPATTTSPPAQFEITDLRIIPENPKVGDTLIVLIDVFNNGKSSESYTVLVIIGGTSQKKTVYLKGKSSKTVEFQKTLNIEGYMEIRAGNFTKIIYVMPLKTPASTYSPTPSPTTPAPTSSTKTWHYVALFSGNGDGTTSEFFIKGHQWKVEYKFSSTSVYCSFHGFVYVYKGICIGDWDCVGHCKGKIDLANGNKNYYLKVETEDWGNWELVVYDYY